MRSLAQARDLTCEVQTGVPSGRGEYPRIPRVVLSALLGLVMLTGSIRPAAAIPQISRDEIISIAQSGVGCPYVWGGTCWDPYNKSWKGADCSGYVTKCWQIPTTSQTTECGDHPYTTSTFKNSNTHWTNISRDQMLRGDAVVKTGHIVLYDQGDKWGAAQVYEAKGSAYGIVHGTKSMGSEYVARRRNSIVDPPPSDPPPSNPPPPSDPPPSSEPPPSNPPPPAYYPQVTISSGIAAIPQQNKDFCGQGASQGVFDWYAGQETEVHVEVKNLGTLVASNVKIGLWSEQPYLQIVKWNIYRYSGGSFNLADTDSMQGLPHDSPPQSFSLWLGPLNNGETMRIILRVKALQYSIGAVDHADVRAWVAHVNDFYDKPAYDVPPSNVGQYQQQNGGDLRAAVETDVLDQEACDGKDNDCDGQIDEGDACANGGPAPGGTSGSEVQPPPSGSDPHGSGLTSTPGNNQLYGGCSLVASTPDPSAGAWPLALALALAVVGAIRRRSRRSRC